MENKVDTEVKTEMEQRILEAACTLFYKQGYANTSTIQIAQAVGCNQALVHYYFRTKENLFHQIFMYQIKSAWNVFERSIQSDMKFEELVGHVIDMYFDALSRNRELPFFVLQELITNEERRKYLREQLIETPTFALIVMQIDGILKKEYEAGRIRQIEGLDLVMDIAGLTVFSFLTLPMYKDLFSRSDSEVEEYLQHRKKEIKDTILSRLKP